MAGRGKRGGIGAWDGGWDKRPSSQPEGIGAERRPFQQSHVSHLALVLALTLGSGMALGTLSAGAAAAQDAEVAAQSQDADSARVPGEGDGTAPAEPQAGQPGDPAVEVNPSDVTADSLISRHQDTPRDPNKGPVTNLPLPRYVSLKGGEGNARRGPSLSHRIDWVFRHPGMPLRVVAEFGHWRRVEDQDGAGGWVHYSLLSGVRTAIITTDMAELRARADQNATVIARAEAGAIVRLHECTDAWCRVSGGGEKGWLPKDSLWGVDPEEIRD